MSSCVPGLAVKLVGVVIGSERRLRPQPRPVADTMRPMIQRIHHAYLADTARVVGEVELGPDVNVWYGASIRGDVAPVSIGPGTNVQDNAVIHCEHGLPNHIGRDVTVAHGAIVHGVEVGDGTLIGMRAVVLGRTRIGRDCLIAAGAVVTAGMDVPDGMVVMGVPGRIVRETNEQEKQYMRWLGPHYVALARLHASGADDPRARPWPQVRQDRIV
jgi:carbonic anhydrase/acetyltransferase-like protein (isoleucine patch superfamily)